MSDHAPDIPAAPTGEDADDSSSAARFETEKSGRETVRIGDKLLAMGLISGDQLDVALREKKHSSRMMGEILVDLGFITEGALSEVLVESSGFARFDPEAAVVDPESLSRVPKDVAVRYRVFPVSFDGRVVRLAMSDVYDVIAIDQVARYFPPEATVEPLVCSETDILSVIDRFYAHELSLDGILKEIEEGREVARDSTGTVETGGGNQQHPVVRLVNAVLLDAVKAGASDLHFEPEGNFLRLRYRVDGVLSQVRTIHKDHWPAISHRLKIMSGMNIADRLNPQDGRTSMDVDNRRIDFRVSSFPSVHGENIVLRILDRLSMKRDLGELGFSENNLKLIRTLLKKPEGIFIVTGPTGSGKTTTLYAMMNHINSLDINIMTLEDPVEYELSVIRQAQVREGTAMRFAEGIQAMLRQDPDVILVGEIRGSDTGSMALRAAMTGHQVYTTLHTNDASGAFPRLVDLGMRPSLMAGNMIGVVAQRLARTLCSHCRQKIPASAETCFYLGADPADPPVIGKATGCEHCRHTGYRGRTVISEVLPINEEINELIAREMPVARIRRAARAYGYVPMAEDGIEKVRAGILTLESLGKAVDLTEWIHSWRAGEKNIKRAKMDPYTGEAE